MNASRTYIGALLIAVAGTMFSVLLLPQYDAISDLHSTLSDRNSILNDRQAVLTNIASLNQQYAAHASDISRFSNIIPAKQSEAELVSSFQAMASQNGLNLTGISISSNETQDTNPYGTLSINISLSGPYLAFHSFLSALESNIRLIDIQSISANPVSDNSSTLNFAIIANTYYLK